MDSTQRRIDVSLRSDQSLRSDLKQKPLKGFWRFCIVNRQKWRNLVALFKIYRSFFQVIDLLKVVRNVRKGFSGDQKIRKVIKVDGMYYWRLNIPGWNSPHFKGFLYAELNRLKPHSESTNRLLNAYVAITKKCPLKCEHCFEWNNLNKPEVLHDEQLDQIISKLQQIGTSIISFSGGEPLLRVAEMERLMNKFGKGSAFWVLTSGFNFSDKHAKRLKNAGLTGVVVSLDHWDSVEHDRFRGHDNAFSDAIKAVKYSLDYKLVTALSVCLTKQTANEDFLMRYMALAKDLGVGFFQLLEPKPVGHYAGMDISLNRAQLECMDQFYEKMNSREYEEFPILISHSYYQRRFGCMAAGNRSVYIDTDGDLQGCPFCQRKEGSMLDEDYLTTIDRMAKTGCGSYESAPF